MLSENWISNNASKNSSQHNLPNYISIPFEKKGGKKGEGLVIYIKNDLEYKIRNDLSIWNCNPESLTIEIDIENTNNFIVVTVLQIRIPRFSYHIWTTFYKMLVTKNVFW